MSSSNHKAFAQHIERLKGIYTDGLEQSGSIESVLIHSGSEEHYYGDDRGIPFQAFGHFSHWLPVNRPDQFIYYRPGEKPVYYQVLPNDFWYDQNIEMADWWAEEFEVVRLGSIDELPGVLPDTADTFIGRPGHISDLLNIVASKINPANLVHFLDYQRAYKSSYEVAQLSEANRIALSGHEAARNAFLAGGNEYQIHMSYLSACQMLEDEAPYTNIVALNEKSAILHYQHKRRATGAQSRVLLIDAGCRVNGYGSDITRTWVRQDVHPVFAQLLAGMECLEKELFNMVRPGLPYPDLHLAALTRLAGLLADLGICMGKAEELVELEIPQLFMPHGVGHLLGIQVHDVAGRQQDIHGAQLAPPTHSPMLRNTRMMDVDMIFTVEPGCYFIPLLLEPIRNQELGQKIGWSLVDELYPCGGIRIEDNILVTADGFENLTRQFET